MRPIQNAIRTLTPRTNRAVMGHIRRLAMLTIMAGALMVIYSGCSTATRYKVLSTFFDGVPVPKDHPELAPPQMVAGPWGELIPADPATASVANQTARRDAATTFFYHAPYSNRECFECHDRERGYEAATAGRNDCRSCHGTYFQEQTDDWIHGPLLFEQCVKCHEPHKSEHRGLLTQAQPEICYQCHDPALVEADAYHQTVDTTRCGQCHDPHATGNRLLLADSRTYQRRRRMTPVLKTEHDKWGPELCQRCHQVEQSNVLIENIDQVCLDCHADQIEPSDHGALHQAVSDVKCTSCHAVHQSTRPKLIRPTAEQICYGCHAIEQVQTPTHPTVTRVDCLMCHTGHVVERDHMLRQGIGQATREAGQ